MKTANDVKDTAEYVEKNSEELQKKAPEALNKIKEIVGTVTKFISGKWNSLVEFVKNFSKKDSDGTPKVKAQAISEEEYENVKKKNDEEREKNKGKVTDTTATVQDSVFDNLFDDDPIFESYSENQINELIELANSL
jgi:hypothetical protein